MNKYARKFCAAIVLIAAFFSASSVLAAGTFYYAGWLPYWQDRQGAHSVAPNLGKVREVSPFSYEVNANGTLRDAIGITKDFWPAWLSAVQDGGVKVLPTIAWFDGSGIHKLLSNKTSRIKHEDIITKLVKDNKFDGIDIDYEGKLAATSPYFSLLIQGLAIRLHPMKKLLSCTVEARTPVSSRYTTDPNPLQYANDYAVLNKYCDEVRIMAYDQGVVDRKLNASKGDGKLYAPVADAAWDEKILNEALKTISRKKIMLGIPTYGYEYEATWSGGVTTYRRLRSLNYFTAINLANSVNKAALRNSAGELGFWYTSSTLIETSPALRWDVSSTLPVEVASSTANGGVTRFVSMSDAQSAAAKIALAKKYGLRGVAFFKFDGGFDPLLWSKMK